ncbi:restriction system protein [Phyllobacterium trifolii]|uniref:Restriction system protein n=1 Tax=Phyllobacterium trifolii TaxID=300193 RepID=A0A839UGU8_9HYPH|nr:restriction endonuclease [Phyllobacterium trifolii]MBB3147749.1 restriction system protein [Phyllobacterium trifolii]
MAKIPDYQTLMLPVLKAASAGQMTVAKTIERLALEIPLTEAELAAPLPSGRQTIIANRIHWAKFYMSKARLIDMVRRGVFTASDRGRQLLVRNPDRIDNETLSEYPEFRLFMVESRRRLRSDEALENPAANLDTVSSMSTVTIMSPDDRIESALQEIEAGLRDDLLDRLFSIQPQAARAAFFERLVVQLLISMGYGGGLGKSTVLGGRGDGGVDGVIHLDALGIDRVYVQAKCYDRESTISPAQVREFAGSLDDKKTTRGVFITTAQFSRAARDFVGGIQKQIVLIDGDELTRFMISFGVGVRLHQTIEIKKLDEDFFEI